MGFINVMDPIWQCMLEESFYDFYHLPEYASIEAQQLQGEAMAYFHQEGKSKMLIPLIKRKIPQRNHKQKIWFDAGSPYGYSGILFNRDFESAKMNDFLDRYRKEAGQEELITTIIRLNPFYNNTLFLETEQVHQVVRGDTVWIDLWKEEQELYMQFSKNHRNDIANLQKNQYGVSRGNWKLYHEFVKIYYDTMDRNGASDYYYFDEHYFLMLKAALNGHMELFIANDPGGRICAGGIFTYYNGIVQCHLVATHKEYLHLSPVKLIFYEVIKWGREVKCRWMNLGGGRGLPDDSLLLFKQGFSKLKQKYCTLQIVHDPIKYQNLLQGQGSVAKSNFFPFYRVKQPCKIAAVTYANIWPRQKGRTVTNGEKAEVPE